MRSWHPISKLAIAIGLGGLALVWWLDQGSPTDARSAAAASSATAGPAPTATAPATQPRPTVAPNGMADLARDMRSLPPVDAFASMVERPLFAPARRPVDEPFEMSEFEIVRWTVEPSAAPPYPTVSFVGSIEENGRVRALLGNGSNVRGVAVGELVDGWTVLGIEPRRLTLGHDGEILELTILE